MRYDNALINKTHYSTRAKNHEKSTGVTEGEYIWIEFRTEAQKHTEQRRATKRTWARRKNIDNTCRIYYVCYIEWERGARFDDSSEIPDWVCSRRACVEPNVIHILRIQICTFALFVGLSRSGWVWVAAAQHRNVDWYTTATAYFKINFRMRFRCLFNLSIVTAGTRKIVRPARECPWVKLHSFFFFKTF